MSKPKVLRIINRFNLGGPTLNVGYLSKYMDGFETRLIGGMKDSSEDSSEFIIDKLGLKPIIIPEMKREINWKNDRIALGKIRNIIREYKPDIVHTHASKAGALGRWAATQEKVPIIVHTFHGHVFQHYFNSLKTEVFKRLERYLASKSDAIIVLSELQKKELCSEHKIFPESKARVVPLGFDLKRFTENRETIRENFRREYGIDNETIVIGIVGRLVPIKNHTLFLKAFAILKSEYKNCTALIVGDGECREELETLCQKLSLSYCSEKGGRADVMFTGWIREVDKIYPGLDIVALSSLNEGTPVSLIEAQASGVPIVSTNVGGISDVVLYGKSALLSDSFEIDSYLAPLARLVSNKKLRQEMADSATDYVLQKFSATRLCSDMAEVYNGLLDKGR